MCWHIWRVQYWKLLYSLPQKTWEQLIKKKISSWALLASESHLGKRDGPRDVTAGRSGLKPGPWTSCGNKSSSPHTQEMFVSCILSGLLLGSVQRDGDMALLPCPSQEVVRRKLVAAAVQTPSVPQVDIIVPVFVEKGLTYLWKNKISLSYLFLKTMIIFSWVVGGGFPELGKEICFF